MVFPWIPFLSGEEKKRVSDIEFLAKKEFDSKTKEASGVVTVTNSSTETTIVTATATSGKDMYLAEAKIDWVFEATSVGTFDITFKLVFDTTVKETYVLSEATTVGERVQYVFPIKGYKALATKVIKITMTHSTASSLSRTSATGTLALWEETTGETPVI